MSSDITIQNIRVALRLDADQNLAATHLARQKREHEVTSHLAPHFLLEVVPNENVHHFLTRLLIHHGEDYTIIGNSPAGDRNKTITGVVNLVVTDRMTVEAAAAYIKSTLPKPALIQYAPLGKEIARLRATAKMTQHDLAQRICVMPSNISRWENGLTRPTDLNLVSLATVLNGDFAAMHAMAQPPRIGGDALRLPQATAAVLTVPVVIGEARPLSREEREDEAYDNYLHRNEPGNDWGPVRRRRARP
jgi:transcriptional regulator with XRE-family HTH domain